MKKILAIATLALAALALVVQPAATAPARADATTPPSAATVVSNGPAHEIDWP